MKKIYKNALICDKLTDITVENGIITDIAKTSEMGFDLCGQKVYAGLIDIHTHGCMGYDTMDDPVQKMSPIYAKFGVTSFLPTTMTEDFEKIKAVTSADISDCPGANVLGFHLEGPYISPKFKGAQNEKYIKKPNIQEFNELSNVKMVTIAPEINGGIEFIRNCAVPVCMGHTDADYETTVKAIDAGAVCLTHTFNAMPPLHHRKPSLIGAAFDKKIYAQVICDGLHIHPSAIRILYRLFTSDRMILISDSMRATGMKDGMYNFGGQNVAVKNKEARLEDGTLAGSVATLLDCVKCAIKFGIPEYEAFKMASETPARLLNINKGKIKAGYDADFVVLDENLNITLTVIAGKIV